MLNPFRHVENPKAVWAWGMYDLANQSFQLVINTLLFGVYLQQVVAANPDQGKTFWSQIVSASLIVVVVLSPLVGAMVDARGNKSRLLLISGVISAVLTGSLALVTKDNLVLAALLYIPAAILVGLGENVLAAFLPQLANDKNMGYVSALGWSMSYVGAVLLQVVVLIAVAVFGWSAPEQWRPLFVFAGVWFALGIIPAALYLRDQPTINSPDSHKPTHSGSIFTLGFKRLGQTIREARRYRQLKRFLLVFFVYSLGTQTAVYFAGTIATDFKFQTTELFLLTLLLSLTAGGASILLAKYQDRLGSLRTLKIVLVVWFLTAISIAALYWLNAPKWALWIPAVGIGVGFGGIGTASRALVGCFTPADKSAEFFGLWGMVYKGSGVVGPMVFAYAWIGLGPAPALLILSSFFAAGMILLRAVNEAEGIAAVTAGQGSA